jgi:thymidylate synthase
MSVICYPENTFGLPFDAKSPQSIAPPTVCVNRLFVYVFTAPFNAVPVCAPLPGHKCGIYRSPTRTSALPLQKTFIEAAAGSVGGQQPWPVDLSVLRRMFAVPMCVSNTVNYIGKLPTHGTIRMNDYFKTGNSEVKEEGFGVLDRDGKAPVMDFPEIEEQIARDNARDNSEVGFNDNEFDWQYQDNVRLIKAYGEKRTDRTGVNTVSIFGDITHKIDLRKGFPATTLKKLAFKAMKVETIDWMLEGKFDLKTLKDKGVRIWDQNVKPGTEVYGTKELTFAERCQLLTDGQRGLLEEYRHDFYENRDMNDPEWVDSNWLDYAEMKLNNWGVPEYPLIDGDLGPIYGKQWRAWEDIRIIPASEVYRKDAWERWGARGFSTSLETENYVVIRREIDQVADVEKAVAMRSDSRRIILTGWNVAQLDEMSLPPCHTMAQWYVSQTTDENGKQFLDCKMYQRSADVLLGVPFNISQYALLTEMLARTHGLTARFLHHTVGDAHLYQNHIDKGFVQEILDRPIIHKSARLVSEDRGQKSILDYTVEDFSLLNYESYEAQKNVPIAK